MSNLLTSFYSTNLESIHENKLQLGYPRAQVFWIKLTTKQIHDQKL